MKVAMIRRIRWYGLVPIAAICVGLTTPAVAHSQVSFGVGISVGTAPPPLLEYEQPYVPGPDYIWVPGYWAWGDEGYYWVPGAWVLPPEPGLLWTPGYWGCDGSVYFWHPGYWGRHVGFYGGINYGYGYFGRGYAGGMWVGNHFRYNAAVTHVNTRIVNNVYVDRRVVVNNRTNFNRASYNGGRGGVGVRPGRDMQPRGQVPMTQIQRQHEWVSGQDRNQLQSVTRGHPRQTAVGRPFNNNNRPPTFERVRPEDRVAPQGRGGGQGRGSGGGGPGGGHGQGGGHGGGGGHGQHR